MLTTMNHANHTVFERWLLAEKKGRDAQAEQALGTLFSALPETSPSAGFADRILLAVAVRRPAALPWWSRAAIAASLILAGLAAASGLPLAISLFQVLAPTDLIAAGIQGFVAMASRVDEVLSLWRLWAGIADTALLVVTAPPVVLSLLTLTALSALTFRGLKRALVPPRSPHHVPA